MDNRLSVLLLGAGGIGTWIAICLAQSQKINRLQIFDADILSASNLNRMPYNGEKIGKFKVDLLKEFINERYPDVIVDVSTNHWKPDTLELIMDFDVLIDGTDDYETQLKSMKFANDMRKKFYRVGTNWNHITVTTTVPQWIPEKEQTEEGVCGMTVPQWIAPQFIAAGKLCMELFEEKLEEG
jgi:tRNA A37 threonylcarbamoyladenosine dehydratase